MTKRLKDELETLSKWRTVIQDLPKSEASPTPPATLDEPQGLRRQVQELLPLLLNGIMPNKEDLHYLRDLAYAPPAQEDEPVASVNSIRESIGQGTINILKEGIDPGDYLYTRPSSDELQQENERLRSEHADLLALQDELLAVADCHPENSPYPAAVAARDIRKAAEELARYMNNNEVHRVDEYMPLVGKLCSALEE